MKYNRQTYKRYEFNVRVDSILNGVIERYKQDSNSNLSELIKSCLCNHFGIDRYDADLLFVPYHYHYGRNGEHILNNVLDKYFSEPGSCD
jgi:hypothetical protein